MDALQNTKSFVLHTVKGPHEKQKKQEDVVLVVTHLKCIHFVGYQYQ